jgi:hypothetical protein
LILLADGDEPGEAAAQDMLPDDGSAKGAAFGSPARRKAWTSTICLKATIPP